MIIDAHAHLRPRGDKVLLSSDLLHAMDEAGVQCSIIISNKLSSAEGLSIEEAIQATKEHPQLKAIGHVDFDDIDASIATVKENLSNKNLVGVKLYPGYQNFYPNDDKLYPLYEYCQEHGYPVVYHTGLLEIGYPGLLEQVHPLRIDAVADKFPDLKIVMTHLGNPWIIDCAAVMYKNKNVYADFSALAAENYDLTDAQQKDIAETIKQVQSFLGNLNKCLFGTDWPLYSQKAYLAAAQQVAMNNEEKERVFWRNANEIFRLGL